MLVRINFNNTGYRNNQILDDSCDETDVQGPDMKINEIHQEILSVCFDM